MLAYCKIRQQPEKKLCNTHPEADALESRLMDTTPRDCMPCKKCGSNNRLKLKGELTAGNPTIEGIKPSPVYICQDLCVCLDCGLAEIGIPTQELEWLKKSKATPTA
jgi:hypothetical protein